jgi:hypothetical protein
VAVTRIVGEQVAHLLDVTDDLAVNAIVQASAPSPRRR